MTISEGICRWLVIFSVKYRKPLQSLHTKHTCGCARKTATKMFYGNMAKHFLLQSNDNDVPDS